MVNLLTLARLDAGTQDVNRAPFNLTELIESICDRFQNEVKERRVRLDNRMKQKIAVYSDKDKLKLILMNIIYNALSYSPSESVVVINAEETETGVELEVSNDTIDLSDQDLPFMFERFWRKDQVRTRASHAGLGLSLVKSLADLLNLKISPVLESGARFRLYLSGLAPAR